MIQEAYKKAKYIVYFENDGGKVFQISLECNCFSPLNIFLALPELCSCHNKNIYTLIFTKEQKRYCFFIDLRSEKFEFRIKYVMMPSDLEIIDVFVEDDFSKMMFFRSDGPSKFYDIEKDLKMKNRIGERYEYTLDWNKLVNPSKENKFVKPSEKTSILEKIYQKQLFTCGVLTKFGISEDRKSLV